MQMKTCLMSLVACSAFVLQAQELEQKAVLKDGTEVTISAANTAKVKAAEQGLRRRVAVFVKNGAGKEFAQAAVRLQNQITAQVSGDAYEIVDYRDVIAAVEPLPEAPQMADGAAQLERETRLIERILARLGQDDKPTAGGQQGATQDQKLLANTSRQHLAQNMDVDYFLLLTLDKFDKSTTTYKSEDLSGAVATDTYKISASYKLVDCWSGTALGGDTLSASKKTRQTENITHAYGTFADALEEKLAVAIKKSMLENAAYWRAASRERNGIKVRFIAEAADTDNKPFYLPYYDGNQVVLRDGVPVQVTAMVEVNGVVQGTAPCDVFMGKGLHKVRLSRPGYDDVTMTVKPSEGLVLATAMRMTEAEAQRLRGSIEFMQKMTQQKDLSQAEVKRLEGEAQMFRQSGYKIDAKEAPDNYFWAPVPFMNNINNTVE